MLGIESQVPASAQQHAADATPSESRSEPSADALCRAKEGVRFQCTRGKPERLAEAVLSPAAQNNKHTRCLH